MSSDQLESAVRRRIESAFASECGRAKVAFYRRDGTAIEVLDVDVDESNPYDLPVLAPAFSLPSTTTQ